MLNLSIPATQRRLSLGQTKLEAPSLQKSHPSLDCLHTNSPPGVSGPRSAADFAGGGGGGRGGRKGSNSNAKDKRDGPDAGINKSVFRVSVSRKMGLTGQFGLNS